MGVKGLMTYMLDDNLSLKSHKLRKTRIIIDGNNLLHSIHHAHNVIWQFGGEYESFDNALVKFFERLQLCELKPFVVFDGCYDAEGSKFRTTISRFKDRIYTCSKINKQNLAVGYLLPMLTIQTMIPVLQRLNIDYVTCHEEADKEAAALANYFNCPIVSNDSDFFIFPLDSGFIPVGCLNFIPVEEDCTCCSTQTHFYLPCALFHQSNFHLKSSTNPIAKRSFMPLFATLMGNDFMSVNFYDLIFARNGHTNSRKSKNCKKTSKITALLNWVNQFDTVESAVNKVLLLVKESDRASMECVINLSLVQYDLSQSNLVDVIKFDRLLLSNDCHVFSRLPPFVNQLLNKCVLSPIFVNSILSGNVFLSTFIENVTRESIHTVCTSIRVRFYRILCQFLNKSSGVICEYSRKGNSFYKDQIDVSGNEFCADANDWVTTALRSTDTALSFVKLMISYWVEMMDKATVSCELVLATIASVVIQFSWREELLKPGSSFAKDRYSNAVYKFYRDPVVTTVQKFQIDIVHSFNELQSVYFALSQLLCVDGNGGVEHIPAPQSVFCGKLCYNLARDLAKRKNSWLYASRLFESSPCDDFRTEFFDIIRDVENRWPAFEVFVRNSKGDIGVTEL